MRLKNDSVASVSLLEKTPAAIQQLIEEISGQVAETVELPAAAAKSKSKSVELTPEVADARSGASGE